MSLNPSIRVAVYFRITDAFFNAVGGVPASCLAKWGPLYRPAESDEEQGEEMLQSNTSMREAIAAARAKGVRDVDEPFPIAHTDGDAPQRDPDTPTHWIIGMRNVGGKMDVEAMQIAQAQQVPYSHVKLAHDEILTYLNEGDLPA